MSDPRLTPTNGRVACASLQGRIKAETYVEGVARQVGVPVADLLRAPNGPRDRQMLMGADVKVFEARDGYAYVQSDADGYCGYVMSDHLRSAEPQTHRVSALATHIYAEPSFKSADVMTLSFGASVQSLGEEERFCRTPLGYIPRAHVADLNSVESDPARVVERFLGTPYLWGGNSRLGLDCSGLVQAGLHACGIPCPGDSDMQEAALGDSVADAPRRGDLFFWKGHVAMAVDDTRLIHANAFHMAVVYEGIEEAKARIKAQGDGPVTRHARLAEV